MTLPYTLVITVPKNITVTSYSSDHSYHLLTRPHKCNHAGSRVYIITSKDPTPTSSWSIFFKAWQQNKNTRIHYDISLLSNQLSKRRCRKSDKTHHAKDTPEVESFNSSAKEKSSQLLGRLLAWAMYAQWNFYDHDSELLFHSLHVKMGLSKRKITNTYIFSHASPLFLMVSALRRKNFISPKFFSI